MLSSFVMLIGYFGLLIGFAFFAKWIFAGISILTGNKDSLHDFGNLCDKNVDYRYNEHRGYYDWRNRGEGNMGDWYE